MDIFFKSSFLEAKQYDVVILFETFFVGSHHHGWSLMSQETNYWLNPAYIVAA